MQWGFIKERAKYSPSVAMKIQIPILHALLTGPDTFIIYTSTPYL